MVLDSAGAEAREPAPEAGRGEPGPRGGGARKRQRGPLAWWARRWQYGLVLSLRPADREDLALVAEAWGVPMATAAWALVAGELARARRSRVALPAALARRLLEVAERSAPPAEGTGGAGSEGGEG